MDLFKLGYVSVAFEPYFCTFVKCVGLTLFFYGVPRHGHDVWAPTAGGRDHDDRPRLEQAIDLGQRKGFSGHVGTTFRQRLTSTFVAPKA